MATGRIVGRRPLRRDAGSSLSVLCSRCVSDRATDAMGSLLEKHRFEKLATRTRTADLATRFLGHAVAAFGKLRFEMAVRRGYPVRAGLAREADEWPFQGELSFLPW